MARWLLTLGLALALLAGCGGGDDKSGGDSGGDGEALSQDELVSQANKICREGSAKINEKAQDIQQKIQQADSAEEQQKVVADVLEDTAKEYDPYLNQLHDLKPPAELDDEWNKFIAGIDKAFDLIPDLADATRDGDQSKLQDLTTEFTQIAGDTRPFATKYKLNDCLPENGPTS
jgi:ABC-type glycerol-3-phosphate transport system substrate-binding protein